MHWLAAQHSPKQSAQEPSQRAGDVCVHDVLCSSFTSAALQSLNREEGNVTWSRSDLAQFLINEAQQRYPNQIRFHFNKEVEGVDLQGKKVSALAVRPPVCRSIHSLDGPWMLISGADCVWAESHCVWGGSCADHGLIYKHTHPSLALHTFPQQVAFGTPAATRLRLGLGQADHDTSVATYDLLVGADGAGSAVRDALQASIPGFSVDVQDSGREYKVRRDLLVVFLSCLLARLMQSVSAVARSEYPLLPGLRAHTQGGAALLLVMAGLKAGMNTLHSGSGTPFLLAYPPVSCNIHRTCCLTILGCP